MGRGEETLTLTDEVPVGTSPVDPRRFHRERTTHTDLFETVSFLTFKGCRCQVARLAVRCSTPANVDRFVRRIPPEPALPPGEA